MSSNSRLLLEICIFLTLGVVAVVAGVLAMIASVGVIITATTLGSSSSRGLPSFARRKKHVRKKPSTDKPARATHANDHIINELEQQFKNSPSDPPARGQ